MIINMTTISKRKVHYIRSEPLESLFRSDGRDLPVNLIVGSFDSSYLDKYQNMVHLVPWDQAAQWFSREGRPRHNCNVNAIRALKHGDDDYCLTCEDDIVFATDWYNQLAGDHCGNRKIPGTMCSILARRYQISQWTSALRPLHTQPYLCGRKENLPQQSSPKQDRQLP